MELKIFNPSFNSGEVLTAEKLNDLRDATNEFLKVKYGEFGTGILFGFDFTKSGKKIYLSEGLLKLNNKFLYLTQKYEILLKNNSDYYVFIEEIDNRYQIKVSKTLTKNNRYLFAHIEYTGGDIILLPNSFLAIDKTLTNYFNILETYYSIKGGSTLPKPILNLFAKEYLEKYSEINEDYIFAINCITDNITKGYIDLYLKMKGLPEKEFNNNTEIYKILKTVLSNSYSRINKPVVNTKKNKQTEYV